MINPSFTIPDGLDYWEARVWINAYNILQNPHRPDNYSQWWN